MTAIDPLIGQTINNYRICARIAEGGMGTVYAAEHPFMGRRAAVKVLRPHFARDEWMVALFMNEARAANAIGHPNIIDIMDVGRLPDGQPYLMMELLAGETLADRLARVRRLPVADALDFVEQAAAALAVAHEKGIVHCDLKPENLFLIPDLGLRFGERVKVLDFGTAKLRGRDAAGRREVATTGAQAEAAAAATAEPLPSTDATALALFGSPLYMAPEQCDERAMHGIDHRADVYALGAVLYHALCGQPPFLSDQVSEILAMHLERPPTPPRVFDPEMPEAVERALVRALAKRPEDRFATMGELVAALRAGTSRRRTTHSTELILRGGAATPAPQLVVPSPSLALVPYRGGHEARRRLQLRVAATVVSMAAAAAVAVAWWWPSSAAGLWTSQVRDRAASTAAKLVPLSLRRELGLPAQPSTPPAPPPVAVRPPVIVALPAPEPLPPAGAQQGGDERGRVAGRRPLEGRKRRPGFDRSVIDGEELFGRRH